MSRYFGHAHIRTIIGVFGKLFSKLHIAKYDATGTQINKLVQVPIRYLPMSHTFLTDDEDTIKLKSFLEYYPRITYDFTGLSYNSPLQRAQTQQYKNENNNNQVGYTPAPYRLSFSLHVISRDQLTALQIIEQILPFFRPNLTVSIRHETFDGNEHDIQVNLDSINLEDTYTDQETKRIVHYTLEFTVLTEFWGVVSGADIEIAKFSECGGEVVVDDVITEGPPQDPDEPDPDVTITTNPKGLIKKIIIDLHDIKVKDSSDVFWPVIERTIVDPKPSSASKQSELTGIDVTKKYPTDETNERIPKL